MDIKTKNEFLKNALGFGFSNTFDYCARRLRWGLCYIVGLFAGSILSILSAVSIISLLKKAGLGNAGDGIVLNTKEVWASVISVLHLFASLPWFVIIGFVMLLMVIMIFFMFILCIIDIGLAAETLDFFKNGERAFEVGVINRISSMSHLWWLGFRTRLAFFGITFLGFLCLIIPGLYFSVKYQLHLYPVIDGAESVGEALRESSRPVRGRFLPFSILFFILYLLVNTLTRYTLGLSLLLAFPISILVKGHAYWSLRNEG